MAEEWNNNGNPWLGLQAYTEKQKLYGRDEDIRNLTQSVLDNNALLLYGKSGIGKSSIINAGVIPSSRRRGFHSVSLRLDHGENHPSYIEQIRNALTEKGVCVKKVSDTSTKNLLWEFFHRNQFCDSKGNRVKLLLIFDQFEEIFTLQSNIRQRRAFFRGLTDVINDIVPEQIYAIGKETYAVSNESVSLEDLDIDFSEDNHEQEFVNDNDVHIVFTIREDFLSEFEYYTSSIPSLKQHRYGLRSINEEQAEEIICKPRSGLVSKDVALLIIQKITGRYDFKLDGVPEIEVDSALLSLYLKSLYDSKTEDIISSELVERKSGAIIPEFYQSCIEDIAPDKIEKLEDLLLNEDGRRDVQSLAKLNREVGSDVVKQLTKKKLIRQFPYGGDYRVEFIHDILCDVVRRRKEIREQNKMIAQKEHEAALRQAQIERDAEIEKQKSRRNLRISIFFSCALSFVGGLIFLLFCRAHVWDVSENYTAFVLRNGWPVGVGKPLSNEEASRLTFYYKLQKKGTREKHYTDVFVVNKKENITINDLSTPIVLAEEKNDEECEDPNVVDFAGMLAKVKHISFEKSSSDTSMTSKQVFYDQNGNVLFAYLYTTAELAGHGKSLWCTFVRPSGKPLKVRETVDRMYITLDSLGYEMQYMFYDAQGHPCHNYYESCYGISQIIDPKDNRVKEISYLDAFGNELCKESITRKKNIREETYEYNESVFKDVDYSEIEYIYDSHGNVAQKRYYKSGQLYQTNMHPAVTRYKYYEKTGLLKKEISLDEKSIPTTGEKYYTYKSYQYDDRNNYTLKSKLQQDTVFPHDTIPGRLINKVYYKKGKGKIIAIEYYYILKKRIKETTVIDANHNGRILKRCFTDVDNSDKPLCHPDSGYYMMECTYEKARYRNMSCEKITCTYYDEKNNLCLVDGGVGYDKNYAVDIRWIHKVRGVSNIVKHVTLDTANRIVWSMGYEYNANGTLNKQYVVGIEDTPIRCPQWEIDGLCYYQLQIVRDFDENFSRLLAISEDGSNQTLVYAGISGAKRTPRTKRTSTSEIGNAWSYTTGDCYLSTYEVDKQRCKQVHYLHLFSRNEKFRDGDIILGADGDDIKPVSIIKSFSSVVRFDHGKHKWIKVDDVTVSDIKVLDAEYYPIYLSEYESELIN